jgi:hypothetical protein
MIETSTKNSESQRSQTVRQSAGQVAHDIAALAELQVELLKTDARESVRRFTLPLAVFALGLALLAASLPILLTAAALALVASGLSPAVAFVSVGLAAATVAAVIAAWAVGRFRGLPAAFARSSDEFVRNLSWIRDALLNLAGRPRASEEDPDTNHHH